MTQKRRPLIIDGLLFCVCHSLRAPSSADREMIVLVMRLFAFETSHPILMLLPSHDVGTEAIYRLAIKNRSR
tara:strand:- start:318 stop:533 length:216 start_codon:yes stop_codon:yes gene_type:complete